jgi:hypothetical protein
VFFDERLTKKKMEISGKIISKEKMKGLILVEKPSKDISNRI